MEYIIVGDTAEFESCLVYPCGSNKENAEKILNRILNNPTESDLHFIKNHKNFRIKEVKACDCWWNDPFLAN